MALNAVYGNDLQLLAIFRNRAKALAFMRERFDLEYKWCVRFRSLSEMHLMNMSYAEAVHLEELINARPELAEQIWASADNTSIDGIDLPERPNFAHAGFTCHWEGCETYNPPARIYLGVVGPEPQFDFGGGYWHSMDRWGNYHVRCAACEYGYYEFRARGHHMKQGERLYPEISVVLHPRNSTNEVIEKTTSALVDAGLAHHELQNFRHDIDKVRHFSDSEQSVRRVANNWITVMMINLTELERG